MDIIPNPITVNGQRQEDDGWERRPDDFQRIVSVTVVRLHAWTAAVLDQVDDVGALSQHKNNPREPENDTENEVDLLPADGDTGRKTVDVADTLLGHCGNNKQEEEKSCGKTGKETAGEVEWLFDHRNHGRSYLAAGAAGAAAGAAAGVASFTGGTARSCA